MAEHRLSLTIQQAGTSEIPASRPQIRRWVQAALERPAELLVRFVDTREACELNRTWRGQDHATNVLTFDYQREPIARADLVICLPVVRREAQRQKKRIEHHLAHLLVHGTLHAQGYDHLDGAQALEMESREQRILARFRIADPYA